MDPTDAPVWGPPSGHILLNFEYARLIRSLFRRAALSSSLSVPVKNIIFLIAPVAISSLLSVPVSDKEKAQVPERICAIMLDGRYQRATPNCWASWAISLA